MFGFYYPFKIKFAFYDKPSLYCYVDSFQYWKPKSVNNFVSNLDILVISFTLLMPRASLIDCLFKPHAC